LPQDSGGVWADALPVALGEIVLVTVVETVVVTRSVTVAAMAGLDFALQAPSTTISVSTESARPFMARTLLPENVIEP
jgi:hypothetical protein